MNAKRGEERRGEELNLSACQNGQHRNSHRGAHEIGILESIGAGRLQNRIFRAHKKNIDGM